MAMEFTSEQQGILMNLARAVIRRALGGAVDEAILRVEECRDPVLLQPAGCFVSLHQRADHRLRGCVGRLDARSSLLLAVRDTAGNVLEDPRFTMQRLQLEELPLVDMDISILSPLLPAETPLDFDLLNEGIYLVFGDRAGCFLPQVARETGWTKEQLLDRLCTEKLGVSAIVWQHPNAKLFKFSSVILGPEAF